MNKWLCQRASILILPIENLVFSVEEERRGKKCDTNTDNSVCVVMAESASSSSEFANKAAAMMMADGGAMASSPSSYSVASTAAFSRCRQVAHFNFDFFFLKT